MKDKFLPGSTRKGALPAWQCAALVALLGCSLLLSACSAPKKPYTPTLKPSPTPQISTQITPSTTPTMHAESLYTPGTRTFATARINPVTAIPPVFQGVSIPSDVKVWVLLGVDSDQPFSGRTEAIHILLINPRLAKASLFSIPGSLYVFIPGYTMQRINTAYALGGIPLLKDTLAYNFGLDPERYVLVHPDDFEWLVDELGSLEVSVLFPLPDACNGIRSGVQLMNGKQALCYVSYQDDEDEIDRMRRQQQLLRIIFNNMVYNGNLARLPRIYATLAEWIETNFSLSELSSYIPLALKLADPDRIKYYMIGWESVEIWELPDHTQVKVLLPDQASVREILANAVESVMQPAPVSALVLTLEYQLTEAMTVTPAFTATRTLTPSAPTPTRTRTPATTQPTTGFTPTRTPTPLPYPIETETPYP